MRGCHKRLWKLKSGLSDFFSPFFQLVLQSHTLSLTVASCETSAVNYVEQHTLQRVLSDSSKKEWTTKSVWENCELLRVFLETPNPLPLQWGFFFFAVVCSPHTVYVSSRAWFHQRREVRVKLESKQQNKTKNNKNNVGG